MTDSESAKPKPILRNQFALLKACKHGLFLYNANDNFIGRSLDDYGEWCESELALLGQLLQPGQVVLDVGANIGTHTVFFAKRVGPQGLVYAFEPQRLVFQNLCANIALNALTNVHALPVGLGEVPTTIKVPLLSPTEAHNFGAYAIDGHALGEAVQLVRIDDLGLDRCHLIKVDVEGMEARVLQGAAQTIAQFHPVLFVENNTQEHAAEIIDQVLALDYQAYWHISSYFNPNNFFKNQFNIFQKCQPEANMFCVHQSIKVNIPDSQKVLGSTDDWVQALKRLKHPNGG